MSASFFRTIWAIFRKDIAVWWNNRRNVTATLIPPLVFLLVQAVGAVAVGRSPVALVTLDSGPQGRLMQQIFHQALKPQRAAVHGAQHVLDLFGVEVQEILGQQF